MDNTLSLGTQDAVQDPASDTPSVTGAPVTDAVKDLKEHNSKVYSSGMQDMAGRMSKQVFNHFKALGIEPVNDNIDETFSVLGERLKSQGGQQQDEEFKKRLEAVSQEATTWKSQAEKSEAEKNQYILNAEILRSIGPDAVDAQAVATLFQSEYKIQRLTDGTVHVYDKSGKLLKTNAWEDVTLEDAMKLFLEQRPYLKKSGTRASTAQNPHTGSPVGIMNRGRSDADVMREAREKAKNL
jgi:hypothetical protein